MSNKSKKIDTAIYNRELEPEDDTLVITDDIKLKVNAIHELFKSWPKEDILRSLEEHDYDVDSVVNSKIEGKEEWTPVKQKTSREELAKKKNKQQPQSNGRGRGRGGATRGGRGGRGRGGSRHQNSARQNNGTSNVSASTDLKPAPAVQVPEAKTPQIAPQTVSQPPVQQPARPKLAISYRDVAQKSHLQQQQQRAMQVQQQQAKELQTATPPQNEQSTAPVAAPQSQQQPQQPLQERPIQPKQSRSKVSAKKSFKYVEVTKSEPEQPVQVQHVQTPQYQPKQPEPEPEPEVPVQDNDQQAPEQGNELIIPSTEGANTLSLTAFGSFADSQYLPTPQENSQPSAPTITSSNEQNPQYPYTAWEQMQYPQYNMQDMHSPEHAMLAYSQQQQSLESKGTPSDASSEPANANATGSKPSQPFSKQQQQYMHPYQYGQYYGPYNPYLPSQFVYQGFQQPKYQGFSYDKTPYTAYLPQFQNSSASPTGQFQYPPHEDSQLADYKSYTSVPYPTQMHPSSDQPKSASRAQQQGKDNKRSVPQATTPDETASMHEYNQRFYMTPPNMAYGYPMYPQAMYPQHMPPTMPRTQHQQASKTSSSTPQDTTGQWNTAVYNQQ